MTETDKRGKLNDSPFDYTATKDGRLLLYWEGKLVKTLKGKQAEKLILEYADLEEHDLQLALARATGNFKRGNERDNREKDED